LYGQARVYHPRDSGWTKAGERFPDYINARQIFELDLDLVQGSCGYAVPYYELKGERPTLANWAEKRGKAGIEAYWKEKNAVSLDNKDTGIL
jgi:hypothetical protein